MRISSPELRRLLFHQDVFDSCEARLTQSANTRQLRTNERFVFRFRGTRNTDTRKIYIFKHLSDDVAGSRRLWEWSSCWFHVVLIARKRSWYSRVLRKYLVTTILAGEYRDNPEIQLLPVEQSKRERAILWDQRAGARLDESRPVRKLDVSCDTQIGRAVMKSFSDTFPKQSWGHWD